MCTPCGLRSVIKILEIVNEVFDNQLGKIPSYVTVENWIKKLGLDVYQDDKPRGTKLARVGAIIDEGISVFHQKLLVLLEIPAEHLGRPLQHKDVVVRAMEVSDKHTGEDVKNLIEKTESAYDTTFEYVVNDQGRNLVSGVNASNKVEHYDISHYLGNCMRHVFGKNDDFNGLISHFGDLRLRYQLTEKSTLVPPNMRTIARFMNVDKWIYWANDRLMQYNVLDKESQEALACIPQNRELITELKKGVDAIRKVETIFKHEGMSLRTLSLAHKTIVDDLIIKGQSGSRRLGLEMLEYVNHEYEQMQGCTDVINNSSDIIESTFGIWKSKKSPNKQCGITSFILTIPLYPMVAERGAAKTFNFKERLCNTKMKDVAAWSNLNTPHQWATNKNISTQKQSQN